MALLTKEDKQQITETFGKDPKDTGQSEVQIALFSKRITHLTEHLKVHRKDFGSRRGMLRLISKRRRLLNYIKSSDEPRYQKTIKALNLRW